MVDGAVAAPAGPGSTDDAALHVGADLRNVGDVQRAADHQSQGGEFVVISAVAVRFADLVDVRNFMLSAAVVAQTFTVVLRVVRKHVVGVELELVVIVGSYANSYVRSRGRDLDLLSCAVAATRADNLGFPSAVLVLSDLNSCSFTRSTDDIGGACLFTDAV